MRRRRLTERLAGVESLLEELERDRVPSPALRVRLHLLNGRLRFLLSGSLEKTQRGREPGDFRVEHIPEGVPIGQQPLRWPIVISTATIRRAQAVGRCDLLVDVERALHRQLALKGSDVLTNRLDEGALRLCVELRQSLGKLRLSAGRRSDRRLLSRRR